MPTSPSTASDTRPVYFDDCAVGPDAVLGEVGKGRYILHRGYQQGRCFLAASSIGLAQASLDHALAYAKERLAFGAPIGKLQMIQEMIAQMALKVDAARLLILRAADLKARKQPYGTEAAMAKLFASEMSHRVTHQALQVYGGFGYSKEFPAERHYRDSRITEIYEGTSEIQRLVIARATLKG